MLNAFVYSLDLWDIVMPWQRLARNGRGSRVGGEVWCAGRGDIVDLAADLSVNILCCSHGRLSCIVTIFLLDDYNMCD